MNKILVALLLLSSLSVMAQSNYRAAEVTDTQGHVQSGYINYREWSNNPESVEFKVSLHDKKPVVYSPLMLRSFVITGFEKYYAYHGSISLNATAFPDLPSAVDSTTKTDDVFLKLIASGSRVSLYSYTDKIKTRFYIQDNMAPPAELLYQEYYGNGRHEVKTVNTYVQQLGEIINKYPDNDRFFNLLGKVKYDKNDIENLVNEINGSKATKKSGFNGRFFLSAALNISNTGFSGNNIFSSVPSSLTVTPKISVGLDNFLNPDIQQFIFRAEVSLSYIKPKFERKDASCSFTQYTATVTPQLIFNLFNRDAFKLYLDGGVGFNFSQYADKAYASTIYYSNGFPFDLSTFWLNFPVQAGVVLNKRLELFALYSTPVNYTQYAGFAIHTQAYNVGMRLLLKSKNKPLQK